MKGPLKYILFAILFIVLSLGSGFYYVARNIDQIDYQEPKDIISNTDEFVKGGRQNILLLGLDAGTIGAKEEYNRHRSDTMIVVSLDKKNKKVNILSIPRDTRVKISNIGIQKINAAMAYGGPNLAVKTVKEFLGVPIHNYVVVNFKGFRDIVDVLGGVPIDIEKPLKYHDYAGNLHIDIDAGHQVLDGKKAEEFVRYRQYPEGDVARVRAQQKFIDAFIKTALKPSTLLKLPKIIDTVQESIRTDISPLEIAGFANFARQIKHENVHMHILPGEGKYISGISYFIPYQTEMNEMIDEVFFDEANINVAVLNGNGAQGVATRVAKKLESEGFRVVKIDNADNFNYERTTIVYPRDMKADADKIAQIFTEAQLKEETETQVALPTIIVGKDVN